MSQNRFVIAVLPWYNSVIMTDLHEWKIDFLQYSSFVSTQNGWVHTKREPFYIFAQAMEGHYELYCDDEFIRLKPGEAFFAPPERLLKIYHYNDPQSGVLQVRYLHFRFRCWDILDPLTNWQFPHVIEQEAADQVGALITQLETLSSRGMDRALTEQLLTLQAVRLLCDLALYKEQPPLPDWLSRVLQHIHRNWQEPHIEINKLCRLAGKSRPAFYRDFTRYMHQGPGAFIRSVKLRTAAQYLLRYPERSIAEIARQGGWGNQFQFSRAFKREFGAAPASFRRGWGDGSGQ